MNNEYLERELRHFLDADGRLTKYPARFRPKILSLYYLASKFEAGRRYTEAEVNGLLMRWHSFEDWAMLRRELFERRFLGREKDCSVYWLEDVQPVFATFGLEA